MAPIRDVASFPGPIPLRELEDAETGEQCRGCGQQVTDNPFCCPARQRLVLKIQAGEFPAFIPCSVCNGTGSSLPGISCRHCAGTGAEP